MPSRRHGQASLACGSADNSTHRHPGWSVRSMELDGQPSYMGWAYGKSTGIPSERTSLVGRLWLLWCHPGPRCWSPCDQHKRRCASYWVLAAYASNVSCWSCRRFPPQICGAKGIRTPLAEAIMPGDLPIRIAGPITRDHVRPGGIKSVLSAIAQPWGIRVHRFCRRCRRFPCLVHPCHTPGEPPTKPHPQPV